MRVAVVIVAGGMGRRFASAGPAKQFRTIRGVPVLDWALQPFIAHPEVGQTIVVLPPQDAAQPPEWLRAYPITIVAGGERRSDSVLSGLRAVDPTASRVMVHDGARPFPGRELIDRLLRSEEAAIPGLQVTDTIKEVDAGGWIMRTVDRGRLWSVQTPQLFPLSTLLGAHERASAEKVSTSDDAALFEWIGEPVRVVEGDPHNIKVTTVTDLAVAEVLARGLPLPHHPATGPGPSSERWE